MWTHLSLSLLSNTTAKAVGRSKNYIWLLAVLHLQGWLNWLQSKTQLLQLKESYYVLITLINNELCCTQNEINHIALELYLKPLRELMQEVKRKALQRLEYEGLKECESITTVGGKFYKDPTGFALNKYAYYMCYKCNKVYTKTMMFCRQYKILRIFFVPRLTMVGK